MSQWTNPESLRALRDLGTPEELIAAAADTPPLPVNAHIHLPPNFSAFRSVTEAVGLAAEQGVRALGASNYYDYQVYVDFAERAVGRGVYPIFGLEVITLIDDLRDAGIKVNDPGNPGKMYVCGKGIVEFAPLSDEGSELLEVIRGNDAARMEQMAAALAGLFTANGLPTTLDAAAIRRKVAHRNDCPVETVFLQERHVAQAFQEELSLRVPPAERADALARLFGAPSKAPQDPGAVQGEIRSHLMKAGKPAFVPETFVGFDHAYRLILAMRGIPCYPTLADGASPLCPFEDNPEKLVAEITARGIHCAEFVPVRNAPDVLTRYVLAMRRAGIVVTAGTEHNTPDLIPLTPTCLNGEPIPEEVAPVFWEGACVVIGHQHAVLQTGRGYVDVDGRPNPDFPDAETRIRHFAALGAGVLRRFTERYSA